MLINACGNCVVKIALRSSQQMWVCGCRESTISLSIPRIHKHMFISKVFGLGDLGSSGTLGPQKVWCKPLLLCLCWTVFANQVGLKVKQGLPSAARLLSWQNQCHHCVSLQQRWCSETNESGRRGAWTNTTVFASFFLLFKDWRTTLVSICFPYVNVVSGSQAQCVCAFFT